MIVCSCQKISSTDIYDAIDWMRASDAATIITPLENPQNAAVV
ncbi:hypothetical protein [Epibacterium ulvae]